MYTNYYGFSAKPFQLNPDPRFFFASSGHKRALAYLRYGLHQGEGFIVITGDIGTGKTTLVRNLFNELDADSVVAAQLMTTQLEAEDLLRMVVAAFGLPHENLSKASLIKGFEDFLYDCARQGKRVLLVIDEAQNLPPRSLEELRMLSNFQLSETPLLQSFLLGQEDFRTTLQSLGLKQLRQRVIASCHLNPLSEQETCDYIEHRLQLVGWQGAPGFTEQAYMAIHQYTQGIPRQINILCDRLLLHGFLEEVREFSEDNVIAINQEIVQWDASTPTIRDDGPASPDGNGLDHDIAGLERIVNALTQGQRPFGQSGFAEALERRVTELELMVRSLQEKLEAVELTDESPKYKTNRA